MSKQLLRSATAIGANVMEAQAAQSKKDFVSKMSIASKEARETEYWLRLLQEGELTDMNFEGYPEEIISINRIIISIVKTATEKI